MKHAVLDPENVIADKAYPYANCDQVFLCERSYATNYALFFELVTKLATDG